MLQQWLLVIKLLLKDPFTVSAGWFESSKVTVALNVSPAGSPAARSYCKVWVYETALTGDIENSPKQNKPAVIDLFNKAK